MFENRTNYLTVRVSFAAVDVTLCNRLVAYVGSLL